MKGNPPSPRDSHSCTTVGDRLFVFGGTDGSSPLKDLHILDTSTNQWIVPAISGEGPPAREGHSAALVDKRIFIFGGCGKSIGNPEEVYYNDLYILDTEALAWERARTFGIPPCPRDSHTCSSWGNKIIVLGGEDSSDCYLSDVHMLDAETLVWKQIHTSGQMIAPRAGHATVAVGSNLFVFGGFTDARNLYDDLHVLNVDSGTWSRMISVSQGPSARFSVAGDCLDESKGIVVFIGGCNQSLEALDDMYYLYTDMPVQYGISEQRQEKSSLRRELKKKFREHYLPGKELGKDNNMQMLEVKTPSQILDVQRCSHAGTTDIAGIQSGSSSISGKVTFEARILESNQYAYTIETTVNGQKLRGVLISTTSCSSEDSQAYPNKRRMGTDIEATKVIEPQSVLNTVPIIPQELKSSGHGQIATAYGKELMTQVQPMEVLAPSISNSTTKVDVLKPNEASGNVEPSLVPTDDVRNDPRDMVPSTVPHEDVKNLANMVQFSNPSDTLMNDSQILPHLPKPSDNLKNDSEILVQLPKPSDNLKNDSEILVQFPKPSNNLKNDSEILFKLPEPSDNPKSDSDSMIQLPKPSDNDPKDFVASSLSTEGLKTDQEKSEPPPVPFEDLKNLLETLSSEKDEWSNVSSIPITMPAADTEAIAASSGQASGGAGEQDSSTKDQAIG
ncbi:tip elongation aberrant protein 1-like isoform X1 [Iris pallida]|uniref:Tip elongation aberrant protein 1-like isoform X1 n=1 Tax=Iris pallida TaxID=29817 RepID=A0AAX6H1M6_IRIPA|nr:tip elongation aberrant protein 1-like isoform X1 [Iris pallida]